jgi:hypothetical protein
MTKEFACAAIASEAVFEAAGVYNVPSLASRRKVEIRGQDRALPVVLIADSESLRGVLL